MSIRGRYWPLLTVAGLAGQETTTARNPVSSRVLAVAVFDCFWYEYQRRDSNPHDLNGHWILNPARLPIPPLWRTVAMSLV